MNRILKKPSGCFLPQLPRDTSCAAAVSYHEKITLAHHVFTQSSQLPSRHAIPSSHPFPLSKLISSLPSLLPTTTEPTTSSISPAPTPAHPYAISPLICSKCFSTAVFASRNLSTQFCVHVSSLELSLPPEMPPVMHFVQHVSVRLWIAVDQRKK